jgi:hypothetical protein
MLFVLLLVMLSTSCSPASTEVPTMTLTGSVPNAVKTVDKFLTLINDVQNAYDFNEPWSMLTPEEQCGNPRDMCTMFNFGDRLMKWKEVYRLFDCGSNLVLAEEFRYPREAESSSVSTPQYWKYQVVENDDVWLISDIYRGQSLEGDCFLAIDNSTSPD